MTRRKRPERKTVRRTDPDRIDAPAIDIQAEVKAKAVRFNEAPEADAEFSGEVADRTSEEQPEIEAGSTTDLGSVERQQRVVGHLGDGQLRDAEDRLELLRRRRLAAQRQLGDVVLVGGRWRRERRGLRGSRASEGGTMKELVYHRHLLPVAERYTDKVAVYDGPFRATYAEHVERVLRLGDALHSELGLDRGDHFAVMALNSHQFLELYHAAFLGAGVVNPLNLRLAPAELDFILRDSDTKVCFTDAAFAPLIDAAGKDAGIERVVLIGEGDVPHDLRYEELVGAGRAVVPEEPDEEDPVILMYTGGTTGLPKGVLLDQRAEMLNMYHVALRWGLDESFVYLHQTPMFHAASMGGILGIPASGGASTFVPMFEPKAVLETIEARGVTMTVMVPTMIAMLLAHPDFEPARMQSLEVLTYGASPMPVALLERLLELFPHLDVYQGYGMTESSAVLTSLWPDDHPSVG